MIFKKNNIEQPEKVIKINDITARIILDIARPIYIDGKCEIPLRDIMRLELYYKAKTFDYERAVNTLKYITKLFKWEYIIIGGKDQDAAVKIMEPKGK